jgi:hypothetical protein
MVGVSKRNWADELMKLLREDGLAVPSQGEPNVILFPRGYVLPVPARSGGWLDRPAEVADATRWLRDLLAVFGVDDLKLVGTHSLKHTPLSWAAKFLMPLETWTLLGHHSLGLSKSALTYSRDAQVLPLKHYQDMLYAIAVGELDPDATRSGRVFSRPHRFTEDPDHSRTASVSAGVGEADFQDDASLVAQSSESSSSSDSDEGSSESLARIVKRVPLHNIDLEKAAEEGTMFVHGVSRLLHLRYKAAMKLACQRPVTKNFIRASVKLASISMPCLDCFRAFRKG